MEMSGKKKCESACHNLSNAGRKRCTNSQDSTYYFRTVLLILVVIIMSVVIVATWFIGASLVGVAKDKLQANKTCSPKERDPRDPILGDNIYAWYLTYTGIVVFAFSFTLCICSASYIGLCCEEFPAIIRLISIIGFVFTAVGLTILIGWISVGTYLVTGFSSNAFSIPLCKNLVFYLGTLYITLITFVVACVVISHRRWMANCSISKCGQKFRPYDYKRVKLNDLTEKI